MATRKTKASSKKQPHNSQFWSIILFTSGILILLLALIPGESAWIHIHNLLLGLFGVSVFFVPVILIYVAIMIAMDKSDKAVYGRLIQGTILLFISSAIIQIMFVGRVEGTNFISKLFNLYPKIIVRIQ